MKHYMVIAMIGLMGCKGSKSVQLETPVAVERPGWLVERPMSGLYYTGIGYGSKARPDFQEAAKKNALNDLASEISVNIEGNSLLYTLERAYKFEEEFTSTIQATTSELLEGYEMVDSWSNANEYWVYYRLDKAEHARLKALRRKRAMDKAKDLYLKGEDNLRAGNIREAFDNQLRGLLAMKDHWNEQSEVDVSGEKVYLGNVMFGRLQDMAANIRLGVLPQRAVLDLTNDFRRELRVEAEYHDDELTTNLSQLPLLIETPRNGRVFKERRTVDSDGVLLFEIKNVDPTQHEDARLTVDMDALISDDFKDPLVNSLVKTLTAVTVDVPVEIVMPKVFMVSKERNFGRDLLEHPGVSGALKQAMTERGFTFTTAANADLIVNLKASTRKGGEMSGFYTAYLDLEIIFERVSDGSVIHQTSEKSIKGVQLNWRKAGTEAYKKGAEQMSKRIVPQMVESLL